jgi:antitoxin ParD1/3/4
VKTPVATEQISTATAVERWLREKVLPVYDAMEADPARGISAARLLAMLRAHHAQRIIERKG